MAITVIRLMLVLMLSVISKYCTGTLCACNYDLGNIADLGAGGVRAGAVLPHVPGLEDVQDGPDTEGVS